MSVDQSALADNWRQLHNRVRAGGAICAAVVKANAYGTGLGPALTTLKQAGCSVFFVAHPSEGKQARTIDDNAVIYILNGLFPGQAETFARHNLRPVLGSLEELAEWSAYCRATGVRLPAALHIDTGMSRLGLPLQEALALNPALDFADFEPALLMSHFTSSEEPGHPDNARQIETFRSVREAFPHIPASLANSSGIFLPQVPLFDLVRPGYALYGGNPTPFRSNPMRPAIRLTGLILQTRQVEAGVTVGYNARWKTDDMRRLATVSIGYADGYPRSASSTDEKRLQGILSGAAVVGGQRCPIVGSISMDLIVLDVTDVPENLVKRGDEATFIGDGLEIDEVARRAGTIGYEILTSLGRRYARHYTGGRT